MKWPRTAVAAGLISLLAACGAGEPSTGKQPAGAPRKADVVFKDVTSAAGISFVHNNGAAGNKWLPETMGSGAAFFDYDGDGWLDIIFINGRDWEPKPGKKSTPALYRNNQDGSFTGVTKKAGLDIEIYGMGVAAGDYDNDGRQDLYITALEGDRLFRNVDGARFEDVTEAAGIDNRGFGTSAAWIDYDRDGLLDVYVANYVEWSPEKDLWCSLDGDTKSYCTPESYNGVASKLYRNRGDGTFEDVSKASGVHDPTSKSLGVAVLDFNMDGWPDIFEANDTQPNKLYRNNKDGTFADIGLSAGVAFAEDGTARGAMGVDAADYDRSGRPHLVVGNFSNEMLSLFHNEGGGLFVDDAPRTTVGRDSLLSLTFGAFFFDYDLDGYPDIFCANGHLEEEINLVQPKVEYKQSPLLFRNQGDGAFRLVNDEVGEDISRPVVGRGAAYGDYDRDGDLDILVTANGGPARLFRNDGANVNSYLRVHLAGRESNRDGIGAVVRVASAQGEQWDMVRSGSSYCSQSELTLTFGLGNELMVDRVTVEWPSGKRQMFTGIETNQTLTIDEARGVIAPAS